MKSLKRNIKIEEMLEGFIRTFSEHSLDGTTIQKLAAEMDMTPSLIYIYFKNKDDIIFRCTEHHYDVIQRGLVSVLSRNQNTVEKAAEEVLDYIDEVLDICSFLLQVMAHPKYCVAIKESKMIMDRYMLSYVENILKQQGRNLQCARGISYLLNSSINDYILKKSKDRFLIQFATVSDLLSA